MGSRLVGSAMSAILSSPVVPDGAAPGLTSLAGPAPDGPAPVGLPALGAAVAAPPALVAAGAAAVAAGGTVVGVAVPPQAASTACIAARPATPPASWMASRRVIWRPSTEKPRDSAASDHRIAP